tara:strand:- start:1406 stop:1837 length:432 start_codon:yes stop_codon:yes gene_type:complete
MKLVDKGLPDNVEALTDLVLHLKDKLSHQSDYIKQLIEAIQLARHQHFGTRSEKFNIGQLSLLFNETEGLLDHEDDKQANEDVGNDETTTVGLISARKAVVGSCPIIIRALRSFTHSKVMTVSVSIATVNSPLSAKRPASRLI